MDFRKEFEFSFGDYVQAQIDLDPKNNNLPRSIDAIYLRPLDSRQGGHQVMDLQTGRMSRRARCKKCKMTKLVIETVNKMAYDQGYKSFKFLDRKKRPMLLNPIDTLSGIDTITNENLEALEQADEEYVPLVPLQDQSGDDDSALDADSLIDNEEVAELLGDTNSDNQNEVENVPDDNENAPDADVNIDNASDGDEMIQCDVRDDDSLSMDPPSLVSEPNARPTRERRDPEI